MFNRENLDWMKEAPKMSFNEMLGRPVFVNREAFYICLSGLADPSVFKQVEFEIDRMDYEVWYAANGKQVKLEKEIKPNELPTAIKSAIKNRYSDYSIDDCELREEKGKTTYLVELEKWNDEIDVVYDAKGKLIKETK